MLALAFIVASFLAAGRAKREGIQPDVIFNFCFLVFLFGIIGARLFYVIENLNYYLKRPLEMAMLWYGGLSWYGGLAAGAIAAFLYLKKKRLPGLKIVDLIIPFIALGQAIGRIGCLLNGCCFGRSSDFGFYFMAHHTTLVPIQLYSSVILVLIYIILRFLQERPHRAGQIFLAYLFLYSLSRFFIEFWRADNPKIFLGLSLFQIISFSIFCFSLTKLFLVKVSKK